MLTYRKCARCSWYWVPRTESPVQCPHCGLRLLERYPIRKVSEDVIDLG